jgi:hypothetical protein
MKCEGLIGAVEDVLLQGRALLGSVEAEVYRWKDTKDCGASIGMHYRHVLEHFQCVLEGLESSRVDYDLRPRDAELEGSVDAAVLATDNLVEQFRSLPADTWQRECKVRYRVSDDENGVEEAGSTLAREIMFCVGHATHHFALLKPLCAQLGVRVPYEFGIAPSTLKHMQTLERG